MLKIATAVANLVSHDEVASEAMRRGVLNLSAYADEILPRVQTLTWKEVERGSVIVALSRLRSQIEVQPPIKPVVKLDNLSIKAPLIDITYAKSTDTLLEYQSFVERMHPSSNDFLLVTQGLRELTIIAHQTWLPDIQRQFSTPPLSLFQDLVGLTVHFSQEYLDVPNFIYAVLGALALERINIVEVVSTWTEFSVFVTKTDQQRTLDRLNGFLL